MQIGRGWSQAELARMSGLNVSTLRKMRRRQHSAQDATLEAIAIAFGIEDPDDLLRPWEPPLPPDPDPEPEPPPPAEPGPEPRRASPAEAAFLQQTRELQRLAARVYADDPRVGEIIYRQLTGRVRQMAQAVRADVGRRRRG
jgi:transcriptional regulator with XRE-family HTH domain